MKTLIFLLLVVMTCYGCTKDAIEPTSKENVYVTLDYALPVKSGDITAKGGVYLDFYAKYVANKTLTPKTYYINFYDGEKKVMASVSGTWGSKALVSLPPGTYATDGFSWPTSYGVCGDTAYLRFKDTVTITQTSTNLVLNAHYDCSLILLDTADVISTDIFMPATDTANFRFYQPYYQAVKKTMMKTEGFYHTFFFIGAAVGDGYDKTNLYLSVTERQRVVVDPSNPDYMINKITTFPLSVYNWEAGKYYYFESTESGYNLTPMTN